MGLTMYEFIPYFRLKQTFILVRPPPQIHNHPLNLQIQLVPAVTARERPSTATPSITSTSSHVQVEEPLPQSPKSPTSDSEGDRLGRRMSLRSNRSDTSNFYSSSNTSSVTSFSSGASSSSGRRMIIPLYNLHAHNVMTNTVFDAGTDARVAKYHKRGLEIIGLGILEPTEVWQAKEFLSGSNPVTRVQSTGVSLAPPTQASNSGRAVTPELAHSPGSSRLSLGSDTSSPTHLPTRQNQIPRVDIIAPPSNGGPKRLFGKIFRRKEPSGPIPSKTKEEGITSPVPNSPRMLVSPSLNPSESRTPTIISKQNNNDIFLPAILGVSPTLCSPVNQAIGRCVKHVWVMRRWHKAENENGLGGIIRKVGREASSYGVGHVGEQEFDWMVRFEWSRGKSKQEKAATRRAKRASGGDAPLGLRRSETHSRRSSAVVNSEEAASISHVKDDSLRIGRPEGTKDSLDVRPSKRSPSHSRPGTPRASSPNRPTTPSVNHSEEDSRGDHDKDDRDEESDPEDSETPWVCNLIITPTSSEHSSLFLKKGHSRTRSLSASVGGPSSPDQTTPVPSDLQQSPTKLKIATLSPAPHHPKVVCQLKVPFPLPDIEVEHGMIKKRVLLPDGSTRSTLLPDRLHSPQKLTLTAEEIKDVICCTAFWLVVREGIGGVGKVPRKGDGFRLRK